MSQQELADRCELSVDQITNIECGKSFAGEVTIAMLAGAFRVHHLALFDYSQNDAFVKAGGLKWRASRKANTLHVSHRKAEITIRSRRPSGR